MKTFIRFPLLNADPGAAGGGAPATPPAAPATPPATPPAAPAAPSAPVEWTASLNDDLKNFVQNKGFKDPTSVLESYRNFEKLMGAPKDRLVTLPENLEDAQAMGAIYDRLGRPSKPEEYGIKFGEDEGGEKWAKFMQETMHGLGVSKKAGETLATKFQEYFKGEVEAMSQVAQAESANQEAALKKEWGAAHEQNVGIAKSAAAQFGVSNEQIDALQSVMGYDGVMKFFHNLGSKVGEHDFKGNKGAGGGQNILSPGQAQARILELQSDKAFGARLLAKEGAAIAEWNRLHQQANPEA